MLNRAFLAGIALFFAVPGQAANDPRLAAELKARTQALLDAVAPGNKAPWAAALDKDLISVNENNEVVTKDELLKQLEPLPPGLNGSIKVTEFQLQRHGDVAVATYIADETLDYHGQILRTKFRTTDTWHRTNAAWTIISSMTLAVLNDPPSVRLPDAKLAEYAARYELTPQIHYVIRAEAGHLFGQRDGGKEAELKAEAPDLFFVAGAPRSRKVFYRDSTGKVIGFGDRREGQDIRWRRVSQL
jgi:hypothetical protein